MGKRVLKTVLQQEVKASSGCGVACKVGLKSFYEDLGFTITPETPDKGENISMRLFTTPLVERNQVIRIGEVNRDKINLNLPLIEAEYGVHLDPV